MGGDKIENSGILWYIFTWKDRMFDKKSGALILLLPVFVIACQDLFNDKQFGPAELAFELIDNGTAYRVRKGTVWTGIVIIPATYNGKPVTEIGSTSDSSDNGAFYNTSITSVYIPASVTSIGSNAFIYCRSLGAVTFAADSQLATIDRNVFYYCSKLTSITIPASVTTISTGAFYGCSSLTSITIPAGVTSIGGGSPLFYGGAFSYCTSLIGITIPASVTSIGEYAFSGCSSLESVTFAAGQLQSIDGSAFIHCTSLTSITIPASVTSIGGSVFVGCSNLESVTFAAGSQLQSIGRYMFVNCTSLTSITVDASNQNYTTENGILYDKYKTKLIATPTGISGNVIIPASVTSVGEGAFFSCSNLESVTFAAGSLLQSIGSGAFSDCVGLTSIAIPAGVTSIGWGAFQDSTSLTNIIIPANVTFIDSYAFSRWTPAQVIMIMGKTQAQAEATLGTDWRAGCNAAIIYQQ